jgi:hypothetical protein
MKKPDAKSLHTIDDPKDFEAAFYGRHGMTPADAATRMPATSTTALMLANERDIAKELRALQRRAETKAKSIHATLAIKVANKRVAKAIGEMLTDSTRRQFELEGRAEQEAQSA